MSEPLKCGPCSKCTRRAILMASQQPIPDGDEESGKDDEQKEEEQVYARSSTDQPTPGPDSGRKAVDKGWCLSISPEDFAKKQMQDPDITNNSCKDG